MSEQNREARELELRYQQSLRTIRAGLDPVPRVRGELVIECESSSTWSTADISTDTSSEEQPTNAPEQRAVSSESEESESVSTLGTGPSSQSCGQTSAIAPAEAKASNQGQAAGSTKS